jgi:hypothetical protein
MKAKQLLVVLCCFCTFAKAQKAGVPSVETLAEPFSEKDVEAFREPPKVHYPETWFHYIGGNVSHEGITADLEAIAGAGLSGVQLFHGQFGGPWPGVDPQIACLSPLWDEAVKHTAEECHRLGLRFTMQNCPGWAMSGGPWIEPTNAMRHLAWSRTDVEAVGPLQVELPRPASAGEDWRDYRDITVLAFPTPLDDTGSPLKPSTIRSNREHTWDDCLAGTAKGALRLPPATADNPHWVEVDFPEAVVVRTVEFPSINSLSHPWCFEPGVTVAVKAIRADGKTETLVHAELPQSGWEDDRPISFACPDATGVKKYRVEIVNKHDITFRSLRLFSAARKNSWESEAGWTLRSFERTAAHPQQSKDAYLRPDRIYEISGQMDKDGRLTWKAPRKGKWTILRIGHVNTGMRNSPAPPEGTGWECDKLSEAGPDAHFAGYIGRIAKGPLQNNLLNGMLMDSWECRTQTWTNDLEAEFQQATGYPLRLWLPAVFGYVIDDQETTGRFLLDWRRTIGDLFANKFYGRMAQLAKENNLTISYETAAGDVFPADILEFFKHADIPMCEFWHPLSDSYVGSLNYKPIKPTASAARMYGKPRVAAEAFTSFNLTWDERWSMLKEVANINMIEGVTHLVFHTYTHNPRTDFLPPGTSFGSNIGTPFLRGQTWWKHMPELTTCLARCSYLLERGKSVSDVLWYLGDEISHKPDQNAPFPAGFKYDYCNPDVLLNRLQVKDGHLVTPEGLSYRLLWIPDAPRMNPETLEKIYQLMQDGATVVGNAPQGLATLTGGKATQSRFDKAVTNIWGTAKRKSGSNAAKDAGAESRHVRAIGNSGGQILSGMTIDEALQTLQIEPDVKGGDALWLHRKADGADWYFVSAPQGKDWQGTLDFRCTGSVALWDPVTGTVVPAMAQKNGDYTSVPLRLSQAGCCFVVFRTSQTSRNPRLQIAPDLQAAASNAFVYGSGLQQEIPDNARRIILNNPWTISFPNGWDAPESIYIKTLQPWKELDMSVEAKAFSGTATYTTTFEINEVRPGMKYLLDLGKVEMIAVVSVNGKPLRTLWTPPYRLDISEAIHSGSNTLTVEVTSTWFNRLAYDAGQPEENRKTWTIGGPDKNAPLRDSGLLGPVSVIHFQ